MKKLINLSLVLMIAAAGSAVLAQEDSLDQAVLDENIQASDLGIQEPNLLPDSPLYFLKEWGRNVQSFFTFDSVKKLQLTEKFASEKLIEVKKMVEQNKNRERVEAAVQNYQEEMDEVKRVAEKIQTRAEESEEVGKFLDKFIQQQTLHQRVLQKLGDQVPTEVFEKIEAAREMHLERFGEVMTSLESNGEKLQERLENNLEQMEGSEFKSFKNLEILKELGEKVPEQAKEALQKAQENTLRKLKEKLELMPVETQGKFNEYVEQISGSNETKMELLENLRDEMKTDTNAKTKLLQTRDKLLEKAQIRETETIQNKEMNQEQIQVRKQEQACNTLWSPVCGKDGKTYSNSCFAKLAETEISFEGECGYSE